MDYFKLIKKAYQISIKNRFLWIFGLFTMGAAGLGSARNSRGHENTKMMDFFNLHREQMTDFLNQHLTTFIILAFLFLVLVIIYLALAFISEAALISSVAKLGKGEKQDFSLALKAGAKHFWRIISLGLIYCLTLMAIATVIGVPLAMFVMAKIFIVAIIWGILGLFVFLFAAIFLVIVAPYSYRILVLENKSVSQSFEMATHFVRKNLVKVIWVYLSIVAVSILFAAVAFAGLFGIGGIIFLILLPIWFSSHAAAIYLGLLFGLALCIALLTMVAIFKTFKSVMLTLAYEELKK